MIEEINISRELMRLKQQPHRVALASKIMRELSMNGIFEGEETETLCRLLGERNYMILAKANDEDIHIKTFLGAKKELISLTQKKVEKQLIFATLLMNYTPSVSIEQQNVQEKRCEQEDMHNENCLEAGRGIKL